MNLKVFIGEILKKLGLLRFCLTVVRKYGYLTKFTDHHAHGVDLMFDISQDISISEVIAIFDVGSSNGSMTELYLKAFPKSKIHCFEPYSPSYKILKDKFGKNNRVILNNIALSDQPGQLRMYIQKDSGYNSLNDAVNKPSEDMNGKFEIVSIDTISNYCKMMEVNSIDFIKIDTEGLDLKVLQGCEGMLKQGKIKYVFVECTFNQDNLQNTQFQAINEYLQKFSYKVRAIYDQSNFGNKSYLTCVNAMFLLQEKSKL